MPSNYIQTPTGVTRDKPCLSLDSGDWGTGQKTGITQPLSLLSTETTELWSGVTIKASTANAVNLFVGTTSVTTANGFVLGPGESVSIYSSRLDKIGLISATTTTGAVSFLYQ